MLPEAGAFNRISNISKIVEADLIRRNIITAGVRSVLLYIYLQITYYLYNIARQLRLIDKIKKTINKKLPIVILFTYKALDKLTSRAKNPKVVINSTKKKNYTRHVSRPHVSRGI